MHRAVPWSLPEWILLAALTVLVCGCAAGDRAAGAPSIRYVGSSTIANYIRAAEPVYGNVRFVVDTVPESVGGEIAIREGRADLAGVAGHPGMDTLALGVTATLIGQDAIAVVVHPGNPVADLTVTQLKGIFSGEIRNWKEVGGADVDIRPCTVGPESATRAVFRSAILGETDYAGCEVVRPDSSLLATVRDDPGAIGQISFSFLDEAGSVKAVTVDGHEPMPTNSDYPITRPLYLLWWEGRARVADFVRWTANDPAAAAVLLECFACAGRETSRRKP